MRGEGVLSFKLHLFVTRWPFVPLIWGLEFVYYHLNAYLVFIGRSSLFAFLFTNQTELS